MELLQTEKYENLAAEWQYQMIILLKNALEKRGIEGGKAKDICGDFAFDLAMLHDQGEINAEGNEFKPVLCFDDFDGTLHIPDEFFQIHDYAFGNADEAFEK